MNDRLPYADVSIATVLVAVGTALAAYPWLGGTATLSIALVAAAVIAMLAVFAGALRVRPRGVTSGQIPWN